MEEKKDDTLRPLLVKLRSEKLKWDIIKSSKNLKYLKNGISHPIYVTWDKTVKERQEWKKLIAELKSRKNNGKQNLVIRITKLLLNLCSLIKVIIPFHPKPRTSGLPCSSKSDCLKITYFNSRSILNKKNILLDYLLHVNPSIDILLISETWLNSTVLDSLICPPGYHTLRCDRTIARGGGVMILYKKNLIISQYSPAITIDCAELIAVDVLLKKFNLQFRLICCYLSPKAAGSAKNVEKLCKVIDNCIAGSSLAYIIGDFNLPNINWSIPSTNSGPSHQTFLDFVTYNSLGPLITEPPHCDEHVIDLLLCNLFGQKYLMNYYASMPLSTSCDHSSIHFSLQWESRFSTSKTFATALKKLTMMSFAKYLL